MKKIYAFIVVLLSTLKVFGADLDVTDGTVFNEYGSSYWSIGSVPDYIFAAQELYWNDKHLQQWQNHRSGGSAQEAVEGRFEMLGLTTWAHVGAGGRIYCEYWPDNNGGYNSNTLIAAMSPMIDAPGLLYNGSAYVDEGGWAAANHGSIRMIFGGSIPVGPAASSHYVNGSVDESWNNAATNMISIGAYLTFDTFHYLNKYANWTNDIINATHYREVSKSSGYDEEHPGTSGAFAMAVKALQARIDTNIWTALVDYSTAQAISTNHCTVVNASLIGNDLTVTVHPDRYSMPFDMPDQATGKTNDCSDAFILQPSLSNAFYEVIVLQNIPNGNWQVSMDGTNILVCNSTILRGGLNWFSICKGKMWDKRVNMLDLYRTRAGYDTITLIASNGGTAFGEQTYKSNAQGSWGAGNRGDALISSLSSIWNTIHAVDVSIWAAGVPQNYILKFTYLGGNNKHMRLR